MPIPSSSAIDPIGEGVFAVSEGERQVNPIGLEVRAGARSEPNPA